MTTVHLSVLLPWSVPLVAVGDALSVDYVVHDQSYSGTTMNVIVRRTSGELLLWFAQDFRTESLAPPEEIQVADGSAVCQLIGCGTIEWRAISVTANGEHQDISPGDQAEVGGITILNGHNERQVASNGGCLDCAGGLVRVAAIGMGIATLDALERGPCGSSTCAESEYCAIPDGAACDPVSALAACEIVPATCPNTCPGVCGCDGKFYCNDCEAHRSHTDVAAGATSCMDIGCEPFATAADGDTECSVYWRCYDRDYEVHCTVAGDSLVCECVTDAVTTGSFETTAPPLCSSPAIPAGCHYPSWQ